MSQIQVKRCWAFLIDVIVVSLGISAIKTALSGFVSPPFLDEISFQLGGTSLLSLGSMLLYFLVFDLIREGKTLGKKLCANQVVFEHSDVPSLGLRIKRTLWKIVSIALLPVALLLYVFKHRFTLQDYFCKSYVTTDP